MKEFGIVVVDNNTTEIVGSVTDFQMLGFSIIYRQQTHGCNNIDELLKWAENVNTTIYYQIGGIRIPFNHITHDKKRYLNMLGCYNFTPAEAVIYGMLIEGKMKNNGWVSRQQLEDMLTIFGFKPTSLRMLLVKIRKKLEESNLRVKNKNRTGYRIVDTVNDTYNEFLIKQSRAKSDYWILLQDKNFKSFVTKNTQYLITNKQITGCEILRGWKGLTNTEAQIFFELVKHRGEWVSYDHLLRLPWAMKKQTDNKLSQYRLCNFISKIRRKTVDTNEVIENKPLYGYYLHH